VPSSSKVFCQFGTPLAGLRAGILDLRNQQVIHKLDTVAAIFTKYAPPSQNDTVAYIAAICAATDVGPNDPLNLSDPVYLAKLAKAVIMQEQGQCPYPDNLIAQAVSEVLGNTAVAPVSPIKPKGKQTMGLIQDLEAWLLGVGTDILNFFKAAITALANNPQLAQIAMTAVTNVENEAVTAVEKQAAAYGQIASQLTAAGLPVVVSQINLAIEAAVQTLKAGNTNTSPSTTPSTTDTGTATASS
jgi:hypothetical protein